MEASHYRIKEISGDEYVVTLSEGDELAKAKARGLGVMSIPRLGRKVVPSQITTWEPTTQAPDDALALGAGTTRPLGHVHRVDKAGALVCSCGRPVMAVLAKRLVERRDYQKFAGTPGYHYLYDSDGMICVATTRFVCQIEMLPLDMEECSEAEYARLGHHTSWLAAA